LLASGKLFFQRLIQEQGGSQLRQLSGVGESAGVQVVLWFLIFDLRLAGDFRASH